MRPALSVRRGGVSAAGVMYDSASAPSDGLVSQDVGGDRDASLVERLDPVVPHRSFVASGQVLDLGSVAGDEQAAGAGPRVGGRFSP
ncbi:hypothetical protein AFM16_01750 [Streptomyces antibioticus]|uniref:Uncharacterized protein n=1 Tax=Streptomyces antibioticus TaxID=1890 RepID=A0ABX3LR46_STRAT|nr:hypothetical protein AFM16_01750 [Streptomyces antibioticus]